MTPALELDHVVKRYDSLTAVNDLSLEVVSGRIFGLLGPNGAGKSSAIRMMFGITAPDSGAVRMFGAPIRRRSLSRAGYLPEERGLYAKMTVRENLVFFGQLSGLDGATAERKSETWAARLDIDDRLDNKVEELSKGLQQKVQFITAVVHDPQFIAMDEPFTGLDPVTVGQLRDVLTTFRAEGRAIVLSTHRMDQVELLCDSICLINRGRAVLQGGLHEIKSAHPERRVEIEYSGDGSFLDRNSLVDSYKHNLDHVEVRLRPGADAQGLLQSVGAGTRIRRFEIKEPSIEQIFVELAKQSDGNG